MIDELNNLIPYDNKISDVDKWLDEFYEVMPISDDRKKRRKSIAIQLREAMLFLLALMYTMAENNSWDYDIALSAFRMEFRNAIVNYVKMDAFMENYVQEFTQKYLDVTIEHLSKSDASFFVSDDRATMGGANESNAIIGYGELEEAIEDGSTMKRWKTQRDSRVRDTHREMEGKTIPIDDYFVVGGSALLYPGDPEGEEKETAGCRCALEYI
jgi:uncharacterized protein with gpF-like domain